MTIKISNAAKDGFLRIFAPSRPHFRPLSDAAAWKNDGAAIRNDWKVIGDEIRKASKHTSTK